MFSRTLISFIAGFVLIHINFSIKASDYILKDAENFSLIFNKATGVTQFDIENKYINVGTTGIKIFTPKRIKDASNLVDIVNNNKSDYEKALRVCLPAARKLSKQADKVLDKVKVLLGKKNSAPAYILFGANNSGGTANEEGLAIGLEVLCRFANTEEEANELLKGYIAHEVVHVYQSKIALYSSTKQTGPKTLLKQSLIEGFADFVSFLVLEKVTSAEMERHQYGLNNEAKIWSDFKQDMNGMLFKDWLYREGKNGKPNDMAYWIGKRIAESYYYNAKDKTKALKDLLLLESAELILSKSGYAPK